MQFGPRRAIVKNVTEELSRFPISDEELAHFEWFDTLYRALCAILFNYVPTSGHPGGSISSGRFVQGIIFNELAYDFTDPDRWDADMISYAAGHKALGLYGLWALRNEMVRIGAPHLLPKEIRYQLRLEDLLGFRKNPTTATPLFKKYNAKALDGHPTPATPFLRVATGPSGFGVGSSFGLALGALDLFGAKNAPKVHLVEGEGGMTTGRIAEAFAFAATAGLKNVVYHLDWNQASIDSNRVTREGDVPGDYVQWDPIEYAYFHDWNVIVVPDGFNFRQVFAAQKLAGEMTNDQPTAIVYRTVKGWKYGIEGKASHGAGHKFCSDEYYATLKDVEAMTGTTFPRFSGDATPERVEQSYWDTLCTLRKICEDHKTQSTFFAEKISAARKRLSTLGREKRGDAPTLNTVFKKGRYVVDTPPAELALQAGSSVTLRAVLGSVLGYYNRESKGALFAGSADLLESTSVENVVKDFPKGYYHATGNSFSRRLAIGGICEDAMGCVVSGLSAYGAHIGVSASYAAFIAALEHVTMRIHGIGQQARLHAFGDAYHPFIVICGHAGLKTGEDGPTHADPQALQLLEENFPSGVMITLTPWDPQEVWALTTAALQARPAIIAPFVTRPAEKVLDRAALGLAPSHEAAKGVYCLRRAEAGKPCDGVVVLQESGVAYAFVTEVLPRFVKEGRNVESFYIASAELFSALPLEEQEKIFPEEKRRIAMGITGFTLPTLYRFVTSERGRAASLHPFVKGHYMGSGPGPAVYKEAGLDGEGQYEAIVKYLRCAY